MPLAGVDVGRSICTCENVDGGVGKLCCALAFVTRLIQPPTNSLMPVKSDERRERLNAIVVVMAAEVSNLSYTGSRR